MTNFRILAVFRRNIGLIYDAISIIKSLGSNIDMFRKACAIGLFVFAFISNSDANQKSQACDEIYKLLVLRQQGNEPPNFAAEYNEMIGGGDSYPHLDIDGDAIDDSIIRSCGAGVDGLCTLFVKLSSGKKYELEEAKFFLIRVSGKIYVLVGETSEIEKYKVGKRKAYKITADGINIICDGF